MKYECKYKTSSFINVQRGTLLTCEFCVKDLFVLLPDLLLVVFKQPLTQVAHLLQCKRRLVLPRGT